MSRCEVLGRVSPGRVGRISLAVVFLRRAARGSRSVVGRISCVQSHVAMGGHLSDFKLPLDKQSAAFNLVKRLCEVV
jgi:hypothetical protein